MLITSSHVFINLVFLLEFFSCLARDLYTQPGMRYGVSGLLL